MTHVIKKLFSSIDSKIDSPYAEPLLAITFFLESCLLFLPTDPMLIIYCIKNKHKAFRYALIATVSSVLGGITGYLIGLALFGSFGAAIIHSKLLNYVMTPEQFEYLCNLYRQYEFIAIFIAGFTPIPYKAATLTAGFCQLAFGPFVLSSLASRGARYYLYAIIVKIFGERIQKSFNRYFNLALMLLLILLAATYYFLM